MNEDFLTGSNHESGKCTQIDTLDSHQFPYLVVCILLRILQLWCQLKKYPFKTFDCSATATYRMGSCLDLVAAFRGYDARALVRVTHVSTMPVDLE